jgi:hypothetical protein
VEQVSRGGHVDNLHVAILVLAGKLVLGWEDARIFVAKLQITLQTTRRMLWALAVISVRQRHDQACPLHPLDFTRCNELINDALSVVCKVTKLGLPHHKCIWR